MDSFRHTLAHTPAVFHRSAVRGGAAFLAALLLLSACTEAHGVDDGGTSEFDSGTFDAGFDAGRFDAGPVDAGEDAGSADGGVALSCDAEDASAALCPEILCDGLATWHWNGDECFAIDCGACVGEDCGSSVFSEAECLAAHSGCDASLCRATGGTWRFWAEDCGYTCGVPNPPNCEVGGPSCDCGTSQTFVPGTGCVDDGCPEYDLPDPSIACTSTGGEWGAICEHSVCGVRSVALCAGEACHCPEPTDVFDELFGCVEAEQCFRPSIGEHCESSARCPNGAICCEDCGGAGCFDSTCRYPTCDDDPNTDVCGNRLDVPEPA